ncbi:transforming growth factor beta activator LRRC32-like [Scyliorhinus torazame]|uniref:transforming growth factor beta activator LRRC32-like n=1 Tax=Scyliorhinus torazame TaxID=75743 RepID=UPI003B5BEF8C
MGHFHLLLVAVAVHSVTTTSRPMDFSPCQTIEAEALCQNRGLNIIPTGLPFNIWKLDLSVNRIKRLMMENLTLYNSLQHLDLQSNHLAFIQPGAFASLTHLEVLNLANNLLDLSKHGLGRLPYLKRLELSGNSLYTDVVEDFLKEAPLLEELSLARNSITKLSDHTFQGSPSLKHLNLQHNIIIEIESGAFQSLSNLSVLDLAMNSIPCISDFDLKQLQVLNLSKNSIEHFLTAESEDEYCLQWLDLSDNNLLYFPVFPKRNRLQHLDLSRNSIQGFSPPSSLLGGSADQNLTNVTKSSPSLYLTELIYLDLSYNEITSIPWDFFRSMNSLRFVNLSKNCLHSFVIGEMNVLNSLVELDLSTNALQNLSLARNSLNLLEKLSLQDNYLQTLPSNIFRALNRIRILNLRKNKINICGGTHKHEEDMDGCVSFSRIIPLGYLNLQNNNIQYLPPHAFHQTPLVELDISMNPGIHIHPEGLSGLEDLLTYLSLEDNGLPSLSVNLSYFSNLRTLDLSENQLTELLITSNSLPLETMDLRNNSFTALQETSLKLLNGTLRTLLLSGNPFDCCQSAWVGRLAWVNIVDKWSVLCHYPNGHPQTHLFNAQPSLCKEVTQDWTMWSLLLLILMIVALCAVVVSLGCCMARRQKVNGIFLHHVKA